jgi:hypothetical protein
MLATCDRAGGKVEWARENAERTAELDPSPRALRLMQLLLEGNEDVWQEALIARSALALLHKSQSDSRLEDEVRRLRDMLLERGHHEAREDGDGSVD